MFGGKQIIPLFCQAALGAATNLDTGGYIIAPFRCRPLMFCCRITTALSCTTSMTATATHSTTGDCGTLIIPTAAGTSAIYYDETDANTAVTTDSWLETLDAGDRITIASAATTGSFSSGAGYWWLLVEVDMDRPANNTNWVKSA